MEDFMQSIYHLICFVVFLSRLSRLLMEKKQLENGAKEERKQQNELKIHNGKSRCVKFNDKRFVILHSLISFRCALLMPVFHFKQLVFFYRSYSYFLSLSIQSITIMPKCLTKSGFVLRKEKKNVHPKNRSSLEQRKKHSVSSTVKQKINVIYSLVFEHQSQNLLGLWLIIIILNLFHPE